MSVEHLDLADFLVIAEEITGLDVEVSERATGGAEDLRQLQRPDQHVLVGAEGLEPPTPSL